MLVTPDFAEISESITPGTYKARIVKGDLGEWSTGTKYINWRMETFGEEDAKNNGRAIFHKTPIGGKGAFRLADLYRAATKQSLTGEFDTDQLMGKEVTVVVVDGVDNRTGTPTGYVEVKAVKPL